GRGREGRGRPPPRCRRRGGRAHRAGEGPQGIPPRTQVDRLHRLDPAQPAGQTRQEGAASPVLGGLGAPRELRNSAMTMTEAPSAVHIGADDLPFVDIGDGSSLKVIQVKETEGLWIVENIFQAGYEVQRHKHTGPVYAYTTSGAW